MVMRLFLLSLSATFLLVATIVNAQEPASRALTPAEFNAIVSCENSLIKSSVAMPSCFYILIVLMRCASPPPSYDK